MATTGVALVLALRAPGGGASANFGALQGRSVARADATFPPTFIEEPAFGRIGVFGSDTLHRFAGNPRGLFPTFSSFGVGEEFHATFWVDARPPENFVGHPIADAGEGFLHEGRGFDGTFAGTREKFIDEGAREFGVVGLRRQIVPPRRRGFALMKLEAAELA